MSRWSALRKLAVLSVLCGAAAPATADFKSLLGRIPGEANALVVIDLERILQTPLAEQEGWRQKLTSAFADGPLVVPPGTQRLVLAALIDPADMDSVWEVSVMELAKAPEMQAIAKAERGFVDKLGEKTAVWSPVDAYFLQLDPQVLGTVAPANRQFAARWARQKHTLGGAFVSYYLFNAASKIDDKTAWVMAIDLEDMVAVPKLRARMREEPLQSLQGKSIKPEEFAELMASVKGLTLRIDIDTEARGTCTVDFGKSPAFLGEEAAPVFLEVLSRLGARVEDLAEWEASTRANQLVLQGKLSRNGIRELFSVVQPPSPLAVAEAAPAAPKPSPTDKPAKEQPEAKPAGDAVAKASQEYYQAVVKILDRLEEKLGTGAKSASLGDGAAWCKRDARRIDRLPVLNVDPDLVAWGGEISAGLLRVASVFTVGVTDTMGRTAGITYEGGGSTDAWGYDWGAAESERNRVERQRRQAAMEERSRILSEATAQLQGLVGTRSKVRAMLTERYKVEF